MSKGALDHMQFIVHCMNFQKTFLKKKQKWHWKKFSTCFSGKDRLPHFIDDKTKVVTEEVVWYCFLKSSPCFVIKNGPSVSVLSNNSLTLAHTGKPCIYCINWFEFRFMFWVSPLTRLKFSPHEDNGICDITNRGLSNRRKCQRNCL